jgi:outer membrane protein OmpA-like peptidoglycan-associated protein
MNRLSRSALLVLSCLAAGAPAATRAQIPEFDLERLRLDPAAVGSLVQGTGTLAPAGTLRLSYVIAGEGRPLAYREDGLLLGNGFGGTTDRVEDYISDRIGIHVLASWTVASWLELHGELPVMGWQIGDDLSAVGVPNPKKTALAAPWLGFRVPVFRDGPLGLDMAFALDASGPVGTKNSVVRPEGFVARPRLELGRRFGGLQWGLEAGFLWRQKPVDMGPVELQHELTGGMVFATTGRTRVELDLRAGMNFDELGAYGESLLGVRFRVAAFDAFLMGGPGFGDAPGTPRYRALFGLAWPSGDTSEPRAKEPYPATRPVPPPPRSTTTPSRPADRSPVPAPVPLPPPPKSGKAKLEAGRIALNEKIQFEPRSAKIDERSFSLLDEVVTILDASRTVEIVIEGHTDSQGAPGKNRELSYNRAEAVKRYLVRRGIAATRIDTRGYGESRPIASNDYESGREQNRRVEIRVKRK